MKLPFDKVYYLHLSERNDRLEAINNNIKELNLENIDIWWEVKYPFQTMVGNLLHHAGVLDFWHDCDRGGCYNEWRAIYCMVKSAYLRGLNSICIIEDDIIFDVSKCELIKDTFFNLPDDWEVLRFGTICPQEQIINHIYNMQSNKTITHNWFKYDTYHEHVLGTQAFALSRKGMEEYMKLFETPWHQNMVEENSFDGGIMLGNISDWRYQNNPCNNVDQMLNLLCNTCNTYLTYEYVVNTIKNNTSTLK